MFKLENNKTLNFCPKLSYEMSKNSFIAGLLRHKSILDFNRNPVKLPTPHNSKMHLQQN